jgi:subtilisin-like proprotein convertase family protein
MKTQAIAFSLLLMAGIFQAMSQSMIEVRQSVNQLIPDGTPTGMASTITISGQDASVADVIVNLDITGSYNGDLYAYLVHDNGFAVLLNRVGSTPTDIYGYGDSGMDVSFSDSAANGNIHYYQQVTIPAAGTQLTGTWAPDGRNVSPYAVTGMETPTALLASFDGGDVDGNWMLFVADVSGGDLNYLTSWGLEIEPVPEPACGALAGLALLAYSTWRLRWLHPRQFMAKLTLAGNKVPTAGNTF